MTTVNPSQSASSASQRQGETPYNVRDAALKGAFTAFNKPPVKPKPKINTYSGKNGALVAATLAEEGQRNTASSRPTSPLRPLSRQSSGGASARSQLGVPGADDVQRARSPSNIAATLAVARRAPNSPQRPRVESLSHNQSSPRNGQEQSPPPNVAPKLSPTSKEGAAVRDMSKTVASDASLRTGSIYKKPVSKSLSSQPLEYAADDIKKVDGDPIQATASLVKLFEQTTPAPSQAAPSSSRERKPASIAVSKKAPPPIRSPKPIRNVPHRLANNVEVNGLENESMQNTPGHVSAGGHGEEAKEEGTNERKGENVVERGDMSYSQTQTGQSTSYKAKDAPRQEQEKQAPREDDSQRGLMTLSLWKPQPGENSGEKARGGQPPPEQQKSVIKAAGKPAIPTKPASIPKGKPSPAPGLSPVPPKTQFPGPRRASTVTVAEPGSHSRRASSSSSSEYTSAPETTEEIVKEKPQPPPPRRGTKKMTESRQPTTSQDKSLPPKPPAPQRTASSLPPVRPVASTNSSYREYSLRQLQPYMNESNLANAIVGAALASSRVPTPDPQPEPTLAEFQNRHHHHHHHHHHLPLHHNPLHRRHSSSPPKRAPGTLRTTLRTRSSSSSSTSSEEEKSKHQRRKNRLLRPRKHPNKHHEGSRKRWRDRVTARQRKRYEGVWAANKGLFIPRSADARIDAQLQSEVCSLVVRELWQRSRLPNPVLEEVWELVDGQRTGRLRKEEFVVGMWLLDQLLKGRKLPVRVQESVWASVVGAGVKVKLGK